MLFLLGCSADYQINADYGPDGQVPVVRMEPAKIDFGSISAGESDTRTVEVFNDGDAILVIESLTVVGSSDFVLLSPGPAALGWGESFTVEVAFSPSTNQSGAELVLEGNAPADPSSVVELQGNGLYPSLSISPNPADLRSVEPGCRRTGLIQLGNVGLSPLTIESVSVSGTGFTIEASPEFPANVDPKAQIEVSVAFEASDLGAATARLYVESNEPAGVRSGTIGVVVEIAPNEVSEDWVQGSGPNDFVDVLVYIDQSSSMRDDQENLARNFETFTDQLRATGADWQLVVVNADDGCHEGDILDAYDPSAAAKFADYLNQGGGELTESGLTVFAQGLEATVGEGCNRGFIREGANTNLLAVSDEPDRSVEDWSFEVARMIAITPEATLNAIVGPVPNGCDTAEPGYGYVEAASYLGGGNYPICDEEWAPYFPEIAARAAAELASRFPLAYSAQPESLIVEVDGEPAVGWRYDAAGAEIVFSADFVPERSRRITAEYVVAHDCTP